jgi:hypothetical protein
MSPYYPEQRLNRFLQKVDNVHQTARRHIPDESWYFL